jgi:hypothetical protein
VHPLYSGLMVFSELVSNYSRWVDVNVTGATPAGSDPTCSTGILGGVSKSPVCCAAGCGTCGGTGCNGFPGGSASCCGGAIASANQSCSSHLPPCVPDIDYMSPVTAHASVSIADGTARVLLIAKQLNHGTTAPTQVNLCIAGVAATKAFVKTLVSSGGVAATKGVVFGGVTWDGSTNGRPSGTPTVTTVHGDAHGPMETCFSLSLPPLSAMLLSVPLYSS